MTLLLITLIPINAISSFSDNLHKFKELLHDNLYKVTVLAVNTG